MAEAAAEADGSKGGVSEAAGSKGVVSEAGMSAEAPTTARPGGSEAGMSVEAPTMAPPGGSEGGASATGEHVRPSLARVGQRVILAGDEHAVVVSVQDGTGHVAVAYDRLAWEAIAFAAFAEEARAEPYMRCWTRSKENAVDGVLLQALGHKTLVCGFLHGVSSAAEGVWQMHLSYAPAPINSANAPPPLDFAVCHGDFVVPLDELRPAAPCPNGPRSSAAPPGPFRFCAVLLGREEGQRGRRRFALLESADGQFVISKFGASWLAKSSAEASISDMEASVDKTKEMFAQIGTRTARSVAESAPLAGTATTVRRILLRNRAGPGDSGSNTDRKRLEAARMLQRMLMMERPAVHLSAQVAVSCSFNSFRKRSQKALARTPLWNWQRRLIATTCWIGCQATQT